MSPHKLSVTAVCAESIKTYLAERGNSVTLREAILDQMQSIALNPAMGRRYDAPGTMHFHVFQYMEGKGRAKKGRSIVIVYELLPGEVVMLGCGPAAL